ncbi:MAG: phage holin family protein [candidate division NC10 bacterium]
MGLLIRVLVNALAIYLIAQIAPGVEVSSILTALGAGLALGLFLFVLNVITGRGPHA